MHPLAAQTALHMSKRLLQLPQTPEGGLLYPKIRSSGTDQGNLHSHNRVDGYRNMTVYLARRGYSYSSTTIHKYMNTELGLHSIVRPKKPDCRQGKPHKIFENKINQDFTADKINQKWCTDFTYLFLNNREVRYNCTIIDLYDRSVIASITDSHITSDLAIRTL